MLKTNETLHYFNLDFFHTEWKWKGDITKKRKTWKGKGEYFHDITILINPLRGS